MADSSHQCDKDCWVEKRCRWLNLESVTVAHRAPLTLSWQVLGRHFFQDSSFTVMGTATKDALILFMFAETQINPYHESCIFKNLPERKKTSSCNSLLEFLNHRDTFNIFLKRQTQCARVKSWLWVSGLTPLSVMRAPYFLSLCAIASLPHE